MSFPWAEEYKPASPFMRWLDERLPLPRLVWGSVAMSAASSAGRPYDDWKPWP